MCRKIHWVVVALAFIAAPVMSAWAEEKKEDAVSGRVLFDGKPPVQPVATTGGADEHCKKVAAKTPILKENMAVVSKDGGLKNVFVQVKNGLPKDKKYPTPPPLVLTQEGCHYIPHVFGILVGQDINVVTKDDTNHNIHGQPKENKEFNFSQSVKGTETLVSKYTKFTKPEQAARIKCDVHDWMNARFFVMDNPYFAVTDAEGKYSIKGLPPGEYELEFWHETLGAQTHKVKVEAGKAVAVEDVKFKEKKTTVAPKPAGTKKEEK